MDIYFADVKLTELFRVIDVKRSILPERENFTLDVPSKHGQYYTGYKYLPREIEVEIMITNQMLLSTQRALAWMLDLAEPSKLLFSDEPDKFYYAVIDGSTDIERIYKYGAGTIKFLCLDPFAHSTIEKNYLADTNGKIVIDNQGTAPTSPSITVDFVDDCGYVAFASPNGVIQIGNPKEIDGIPLPDSERLINDSMATLTGWTVNTSGKSRTAGATIAGGVTSNGYAIKPSSYGTNANGWHGTTIRKNLPATKDLTSTAQYWEASMLFEFKADDNNSKTLDTKQMGKIEFNIMDEANNFLAGFTMVDNQAGYEFNIPEFYVGTTRVWVEQPSIPSPKKVKQYNTKTKKYEYKTVTATHVGKWNDCYGKVIIRKTGNQFYFELQKISNNKIVAKVTKTHYDTTNVWGAKKAKTVNIWFGQYKTSPAIGVNYANHVTFRKDNVSDFKELPNLFGAGDKLTIDCETSQVYLNESLFMDRLDIGSTFFEVVEGETEVQFYHSSYAGKPIANATITEKFL